MPRNPRQLPVGLQRDAGWRSAWHIINSGCFRSNDARIWKHVDLQRGSLYFEKILEEPWSSSEQLMLEAAHSLFNGDTKVSLYRMMDRLDEWQIKTVIEAMVIFLSGTCVGQALAGFTVRFDESGRVAIDGGEYGR